MSRQRWMSVAGLIVLLGLASGCAVPGTSEVLEQSKDSCVVRVSGSEPWTDTGLDVPDGTILQAEAGGEIEVSSPSFFDRSFDYRVGPKGTFNIDSRAMREHFPLPAASVGPAPAYALIGRIGTDGFPFLLGELFTGKMDRGGRLYLGVNDFNCRDNTGSFTARVTVLPAEERDVVLRIDSRRAHAASPGENGPSQKSRVLILYIDGLRYDVLKELAYNGYLPNIRRYFFDEGSDLVNAFTVCTADTYPSNAALWTGTFPSRNGIFSGIYFDREKKDVCSFYDRWSPYYAADFLRPVGWHKLGLQLEGAQKKAFADETDYRKFQQAAARGTPALWDMFPGIEYSFRATLLPIYPSSPPPQWVERASNSTPLLGAHKIWDHVDDANTDYACREVIHPNARMMAVWLPGVDVTSHTTPRGQFGGSRRTITRARSITNNSFVSWTTRRNGRKKQGRSSTA